ncbi:MAG: peptide-methionine (R)-S-oxide reductase MsrB [bacterium]|nr:peptide-methionine (R)-S-oxide reductase MsrB [bacterium]
MYEEAATESETQKAVPQEEPAEPSESVDPDEPAAQPVANTITPVELSDAEWRERLTDEQYHVLREKGTERKFTGALLESKTKGTYTCAGCGLALFGSETKFESGTGWPSFYAPIADGHVAEEEDKSHGWVRTEVLCGACDGHLGHVFPDGPKPTGLRYCINSASLALEPAEE